MIEGLERKNRRERQVGLLLAGLRFQYLEMIAYVYKLVPGGLVEDPGLDFMIIDTVGEEGHEDTILHILVRVFRLVLMDAIVDIIDGLTYIDLFLFGNFERYFSTGDDGFYSIHTCIIFP